MGGSNLQQGRREESVMEMMMTWQGNDDEVLTWFNKMT